VRAYIDGSPTRLILLRRATGESMVRSHAERVVAAASPAAPTSVVRLTPKQDEVLRLVDTGLSNIEIASTMSVSESTVKTHLRAVYARLEVRSRTQAVAKARAIGIL